MNDHNDIPPQWAHCFLAWFCPDDLLEEIEGDLLQQFQRDYSKFGIKRARLRFAWNVIRFFRPGILLRNKLSMDVNHLHMLQNYFRVMMRTLTKKKFQSAINIACLTTGIAFTMLIGSYIWTEVQVNKDLRDVDRLYLIESKFRGNNSGFEYFIPGLLPYQAVEKYASSFENYYRFLDRNITISKDDRHFRIQSMIGDPSFIDIFGFDVLHGNAATALTEPNSIVLTETTALKYFDRTDVTGESLSVSTERNGRKEYKVTAVIVDPGDKNAVSDFMNMNAGAFLSLENRDDFYSQLQPDTWDTDFITYIKLAEDVTDEAAENILNEIWKRDAPADLSAQRDFALNSLEDYYLLTNHGAVWKMIISLSVIALLILFLSISNFINMAIASSFSRLREVGMRKVMGGVTGQIVVQFLMESMTLSVFSGILGLLLYELLHDQAGLLLGTQLPSITKIDLLLWLGIAGIVCSVGILAGIYPAVFQSLAKPIASLQGKSGSVKGTLRFSRVLVGAQFLITIFVFSSAIVLSTQVSYFLEKDLGYDRQHVLLISSLPRLWNEEGFGKMEAARQQFLQSSRVEEASLSWGAPAWSMVPFRGKIFKSGQTPDQGISADVTSADGEYLKVYGLDLKAGNFLQDDLRRPNNLVINVTAQQELQLGLGDKVHIERFGDAEFTITGVVGDFNYESLHEKVRPMAFMHNRDFGAYRCFSLKLSPGSPSAALTEVEQLWKKVFPNDPFNYSFMDETVKELYATELQLKKASHISTILMLIIVMTGILGMVSLTVSRREKEIGIRKVLGASISNILILLSREYAVLISVAFVLAIPAAYYFGDSWLQHFSYSIALEWWMFVLPGGSLFLLTLFVVNMRSLAVALANPIKSLRTE